MRKKNKNNPKFIDLFAGCGGLTVGFERAGFRCVFANDIEPDFIKTFQINNSNIATLIKDIRNLSSKEIYEKANIAKGEIDLIIGGPPCQGFSTIGKRWLDDPRNKLFKEYYRILKEVKPKAFVFENVIGFTNMDKGRVFKLTLDLFNKLDYNVKFKTLNALEYGIPQIRKRVFIVGTLKSLKNYQFPRPTHLNHFKKRASSESKLKPYLILKDAINDLPPIETGEISNRYCRPPQNEYQKQRRKGNKILNDHNAPNHSSHLLKVMSLIPEGGDMFDIPKKYRPKSGYRNTYARLKWDEPTPTMTRNFGTPSSSRCIHPICSRGLTTREGARIQSFDDNFIFYGSRTSKNLQIGNAVPSLLAYQIAKKMMELF